jgi:hypothetical protein
MTKTAMLAFENIHTAPPGGYKGWVEQTGQNFHGWTFAELKRKVTEHLRANSLPIPTDLDSVLEDQACQGMPSGVCREMDPAKAFLANMKLSWAILKEGTKSIGSWALSGFDKVSVDQAEFRAATCVSCPHNRFPDGCSPCQSDSLHKLVFSLVGAAKTTRHNQLHACDRCGCGLRVKVWAPLNHILKSTPMLPYPAHCWIVKESAND